MSSQLAGSSFVGCTSTQVLRDSCPPHLRVSYYGSKPVMVILTSLFSDWFEIGHVMQSWSMGSLQGASGNICLPHKRGHMEEDAFPLLYLMLSCLCVMPGAAAAILKP